MKLRNTAKTFSLAQKQMAMLPEPVVRTSRLHLTLFHRNLKITDTVKTNIRVKVPQLSITVLKLVNTKRLPCILSSSADSQDQTELIAF